MSAGKAENVILFQVSTLSLHVIIISVYLGQSCVEKYCELYKCIKCEKVTNFPENEQKLFAVSIVDDQISVECSLVGDLLGTGPSKIYVLHTRPRCSYAFVLIKS